MALLLLRAARTPSIAHGYQRSICTTASVRAGAYFRKRVGLPADGISYGPLSDIPDWNFENGSSSPMSFRTQKRLNTRRYTAECVEVLLNEVMIAKYQHALGMHLRPHELTVHPKRMEVNIARSKDLPILSATADDVPQPPNVNKKSGIPILYTLREGATAANRRPRNREAVFKVMSQDAIRKQLDS